MRLGTANARLLAALVAGIIVGLAFPGRLGWLQPLGTLFVDILKTIVLPVVVCMVVAAIGAMRLEDFGRAGRTLLGWCVGASLFASALGVLIAAAVNPGQGLSMPPEGAPSIAAGTGFLETLVPGNLVAAAAQGNMLGVLGFTAAFAVALGQLRQRGPASLARSVEAAFDLARAGSEALAVVLGWIMIYAPVGVFALTALTFASHGPRAVIPFLKVHLALDAAMLVLCLAAAALLRLRGVAVGGFVRGIQVPLMTAFSTQSSAATLPSELASAQRELGLPTRLAGFAIPFAVSFLKVGSAVFIGVLAVFAANVGGVALTPRVIALIVLATWVASITTAPISGGAMLQLALVFQQGGLPLAAIPLVAGIPFAGKLNTAMNVAGHLAITTLVAQGEGAESADPLPAARPA